MVARRAPYKARAARTAAPAMKKPASSRTAAPLVAAAEVADESAELTELRTLPAVLVRLADSLVRLADSLVRLATSLDTRLDTLDRAEEMAAGRRR